MAWRQKNPKEIPNLVAWYDASKGITLNGSDVSAWADQSGNGNDLSQGTAADQPLYNATDSNFNNQPTLTFDGTSEFMRVTFASEIAQPNTIIYAAKVANTDAGTKVIFDGIGGAGRHYAQYDGTTMSIFAGGSVVSLFTIDTGVDITAIIYDGTSSIGYRDGTASSNVNPGTDGMGGLTLGANISANGEWPGEVAEFMVYSKQLSIPELNAIGRHLAGKYGTTWTAITGSDWRAGDKHSK